MFLKTVFENIKNTIFTFYENYYRSLNLEFFVFSITKKMKPNVFFVFILFSLFSITKKTVFKNCKQTGLTSQRGYLLFQHDYLIIIELRVGNATSNCIYPKAIKTEARPLQPSKLKCRVNLEFNFKA